MKAVLICGGVGSKMWPSSRQTCPKHFLPLINGKSLFEINYQALRKKFKPSQICVQTNREQAKIAQKLVPEIPVKNYFLEPEMRNHGPATGFMVAKLYKLAPDEPFILVQADMLREPEDKWLKTIEVIEELVLKDKKLVTGGERPKYAIMGIDYLMIGKLVVNKKGVRVYKMKKWVWRDTKEKVSTYFKEKKILAHWNHFAWTPRLALAAYQKCKPEWYGPLLKMIAAFDTKNEQKVIAREYAKMPKGPVEQVTCNLPEQMYVAELPFATTDFGTWESLDLYYQKIKKRQQKEVLEIGSKNNFIRKEKGKFIATIGVEDLVIVDTPDALLVCKKDQSGRVGEVVDYLRLKGKNNLL